MILSAANKNIGFVFFSGLFVLSLYGAIWFDGYYLLAIPFAALLFYAGWQHFRLIYFFLLISLPFSAEVQVTTELGTDFPDEILMVFITGLFLCHSLYSPRLLPKRIIQHPLIVLLLITLAWSVVSVLFSGYPVISFKFLLAKGWYIAAFVGAPIVLFREKATLKAAILTLAITMFFVVLVIMFRHYEYDFTFANINNALKPFFRNHVNYSAMLVCIIPIFFVFLKLSKSVAARYTLVAVIGVLLVALFLSYSRGAWLALITGAAGYWLIKRKRIITFYIFLIVGITGAFYWLKTGDRYLRFAHDYRTTIFHEDFGEHFRATYQFKDVSTAERFYRWIAGVRMIKDESLTGFGPATFYNNYRPYAVPAFKTWVSNNPDHSTVHNYFLLLAIEQGIPGLLFFLFLGGAMLFYAQLLFHRVKDRFYKMTAITCGAVLVMILTVNFLSDLIETDKIGSLFFLCLSVLVITDINTREEINSGEASAPDV